MPFPLAHPAAVLPLRRFCPRYLNFPALIIGSLTPDVGYAFGDPDVEEFSHRLPAGGFGFCLPVGLVLVLGFYLVRLPLLRHLPTRYSRVLLPLCRRPAGPKGIIVLSLLLGAWTHQLLDAFTHPEPWLVQYMPSLLAPTLSVGPHHILLCEALYAVFTFSGVSWLSLVYLRWWEQASGTGIPQGIQWSCSLLLAGVILLVALASRGSDLLTTLVIWGIFSILLVVGFLLGVGWLSSHLRGAK
jgi:hypothetical protein